MSKQREIDAPAAIPLVQALCADDGRVRRVSVLHSAMAPALRVLRRMLDHADAVADEGRWYTMHWPPDGIREDPLLADLPAEALHEQALDLIVTYLKCRLDLREPDGESTRRLALFEEMFFAHDERGGRKAAGPAAVAFHGNLRSPAAAGEAHAIGRDPAVGPAAAGPVMAPCMPWSWATFRRSAAGRAPVAMYPRPPPSREPGTRLVAWEICARSRIGLAESGLRRDAGRGGWAAPVAPGGSSPVKW